MFHEHDLAATASDPTGRPDAVDPGRVDVSLDRFTTAHCDRVVSGLSAPEVAAVRFGSVTGPTPRLSRMGQLMLVASTCACLVLVVALYCVVSSKPAAISASVLTLGALGLGFAAPRLVREIDQPSTPDAGIGMMVYMVLFISAVVTIGIAIGRDVFISSQPAALSLVGLVGAVLAIELGFVILCAFIVQVRRVRRGSTLRNGSSSN